MWTVCIMTYLLFLLFFLFSATSHITSTAIPTAFLLIYSIVHAIVDDTFSFFDTYHNYLGLREFAKYGE